MKKIKIKIKTRDNYALMWNDNMSLNAFVQAIKPVEYNKLQEAMIPILVSITYLLPND